MTSKTDPAYRYLTTRKYHAAVTQSGAVMVYDDVSGHYTHCHGLTAAQERYIRARARACDPPFETPCEVRARTL